MGMPQKKYADLSIPIFQTAESIMKSENISSIEERPHRLDRICAVTAAMLPISFVIGPVAYEMVVGLVGLMWLARCAIVRENPLEKIKHHSYIFPMIVWYGSVLISRAINGGTLYQVGHDVAFVRHLLFIMALIDISYRLPISGYLFKGLIAGIIWSLLNVLSVHTIGYDFFGKPLARYTGKLKEIGRIGGLSAFAAPFFFSWALSTIKFERKKGGFFLAISFIAFILLYLSRGRTILLAATVGAVIGAIYVMRKRFNIYWAGLGMLGVASLLFFAYQTEQFHGLMTLYDRVYYWKVTWQIWLENPIWGVGVSSFKEVYEQVASSGMIQPYIAPDGSVWQLAKVSHAHNLMLQLLSCTGLVGFGGFSWLFLNSMRHLIQGRHEYKDALFCWPFVILVIGLTGWNIYDAFFTSALAYFLAFIGISENSASKRPLPSKQHGAK
jgi:O-antigen ligase